jgi:hypothetical protein
MAWDQVADFEEGDTSDFDAVTPAWDGEVNAVADFDAETDTDNDLNDHADAAHDGAVGLELTFDNNTVMYGTVNADAIDQTSGVISFWLNMNDVAVQAGTIVDIVYLFDGASAAQWLIRYSPDTDTIVAGAINDSAGANWTTVSSALGATWHYVGMMFNQATGVGANDGTLHLYVDGVDTGGLTNIDNDTKDWDAALIGMVNTNSTTFGGSYYIDTIKVDPVGGPFASKLAVLTGTYGMAVPIMDATARYGQLSGPVADTFTTIDFQFDPNLITMATNDQFTIAKCDGEFTVELKYTGSAYQIQLALTTDGGTDATSWYTITDASHTIRVVWNAATGGGANNGYAQLFIDDVLQEQILGLDTDTLSTDEVQYGAVTGLDAGTYGIIYFDNCQWNDALTQSAQAGVFEASGIATKKTSVSTAGPFVSTGAVTKKPKKPLAGIATFSGILLGKAKKALAGIITFSGTSVLAKWRRFFARFHDYFFTAPQKFAISSNAVDMTARYRDYNFTAPKGKGYG